MPRKPKTSSGKAVAPSPPKPTPPQRPQRPVQQMPPRRAPQRHQGR